MRIDMHAREDGAQRPRDQHAKYDHVHMRMHMHMRLHVRMRMYMYMHIP